MKTKTTAKVPIPRGTQTNKMIKFEFLKPLQLTPEHDETQQLYCLEEQDLGIDVYAYTRDQLDVELKEQIAFLWDDYAQVPGEELTDAAIRLKQNLLAAVREVPHAA